MRGGLGSRTCGGIRKGCEVVQRKGATEVGCGRGGRKQGSGRKGRRLCKQQGERVEGQKENGVDEGVVVPL